MTIPDTIPFSSIILGERGRTVVNGIEDLAESIREHGLIQPIVVEFKSAGVTGGQGLEFADHYLLRAGGRRYHALARLGIATLHHSVSAHLSGWYCELHGRLNDKDSCEDSHYEEARFGFLIAGNNQDEFRGLMLEIAENHNRVDIDWRDNLRMIIRAYELWKSQNRGARDLSLLAFHMGNATGVQYTEVRWATTIWEDFNEHPEAYAECPNFYSAYRTLLQRRAAVVGKIAAEKSFSRIPAFSITVEPSSPSEEAPSPDSALPPPVEIPLSTQLHLGSGLDYMANLPDGCIDHVVTDPDYAVDLATLESNASNVGEGVDHADVASSLSDLRRFLIEAFRVTRGYCVFFYDLDHHEKLLSWARSAGWNVGNNTPLLWLKPDPPSNGAPFHNFPKCSEYAMVLRKPGASLVQVQKTNYFIFEASGTRRKFGHPFAKPTPLWSWIYSAIATRGQVVLDPFAGKGTAPVAAIRFGLRPIACEIQEVHFNDLTLNLQGAYREALGPNIKFV